jgi:hypothetical protein
LRHGSGLRKKMIMNKEGDVIKIWFGLRALFSNFLKEVSKGFLTPHPVKTQKLH